MASNQHEYDDPNVDQRIEEIELKIDQQLALIEALMTSGKRTENQMKELAVLLDTLDAELEQVLVGTSKNPGESGKIWAPRT